MTVEYCILNPSGNITALVTTRGISDFSYISSAIMKKHADVEQVGFVDLDGKNPYLRMAGGEFCGNATMCTAALFCLKNNISKCEIPVDVFGQDMPVWTEISRKNDIFYGEIKLKRPNKIEIENFKTESGEYSLPIVYSSGIAHIIGDYDFDTLKAEEILKTYSDKLNLPALGFMLYDKAKSKLRPIVYVKNENTLFYENSCASGSCAVCAYITATESEPKKLNLSQPGGTLTVISFASDEYVKLSGSIKISGFYKEKF